MVALSAALALMLVGGSAWLLSRRQRQSSNGNGPRAVPTLTVNQNSETGAGGVSVESGGGVTPTPTPGGEDRDAAQAEQVERDARQLMRRISNDNGSYNFPGPVLDNVTKKVEVYRRDAEALRVAFASVRRGGDALARQAFAEGVTPDLVVYAALARPDGGRAFSQDPLAAARAALPELAALRKKLGAITDEGSLIVVAAYYEGAGTRKSHPLIVRLDSTESNFTKRNVWTLRAERVIGEQTYGFLIRFLALGAMGQDPRRYGIDADPLLF